MQEFIDMSAGQNDWGASISTDNRICWGFLFKSIFPLFNPKFLIPIKDRLDILTSNINDSLSAKIRPLLFFHCYKAQPHQPLFLPNSHLAQYKPHKAHSQHYLIASPRLWFASREKHNFPNTRTSMKT